MSNHPWNKGKKLSLEIRKKMSIVKLGKKFSDEHKLKLSIAGKGRKFSDEHRKNLSESIKKSPLCIEVRRKLSESRIGIKRTDNLGPDNPMWIDGRTTENHKIRNSLKMKLWRTSVFERDNYTCVWCGARCGNGKAIVLQADHIKPFAYYPELRFELENGRTLCLECHKKTDNYGKRKKI